MRAAALPLLAIAAACGHPDPSGGADAGAGPAADAGPPTATSDDLFSLAAVARLELHIDDDALADLAAAPRSYVPADLDFEGRTWARIGVRLKGTFSFQGLGGKAAFKLKFDEYEPAQSFLGLDSLTLNNQRQDHTLVHEWLAYAVFRAGGVDAPRSGFAEVWINGEPYGLYAMVESVDDVFLRDHFADPTGNLYEATLDDLVPEDLWEFDQDEGADESRADLAALIEAANAPGGAVFYGDGARVDTAAFLAFEAAEAAVGHWDGYWKSHNYRIYREPTLDRWYFIPWGTDQTFDRRLDPFASRGLLAQKCFALPDCLADYAAAGRAVVDAYEALDLDGSLDRAVALTAGAMAADPRQRFELDEIERNRLALRDYLAGQPDRLRARFDCIEDGAEADRDGDGAGACLADCDDASPAAHPGGVEVCDGVDNDCNGLVDDRGDCACPTRELDGVRWHLCDRPFPWARARQHCAAQGAALAWLDDPGQNRALFAATQELRTGWWYLGLDDRTEEGRFVWTERGGGGEALGLWASGEPDDWGEQDCAGYAAFGDGGWGDEPCGEAHPFVCREVSK